MRQLSPSFLNDLISGFLSPILQRVRRDPELDLEIRTGYINIYYKGHSLLKLSEKAAGGYQVSIHEKFTQGCQMPARFTDSLDVSAFLQTLRTMKENVSLLQKPSLEIEYEQLIIRANNDEARSNSEYFIVDRQYAAGEHGRFDLAGFYWPRSGRQNNRTVLPCLLEVKFGLNDDIQNLQEQLSRYYEAISASPQAFAAELETIFKQKLELDLYWQQGEKRLAAMQDLKFARQLEDFLFIIILVDYNPHSQLYSRAQLSALPFSSQVRIFQAGFAMWDTHLKRVEETQRT